MWKRGSLIRFLDEWLERQAPERIEEVGGRLIVVLRPDAVHEMLADAAEQLFSVSEREAPSSEVFAVGGDFEIVSGLLQLSETKEMLDEQDSSLEDERRVEGLTARSAVSVIEASEVLLSLCMN